MNFENFSEAKIPTEKFLSPELSEVENDELLAEHLHKIDEFLIEQGLEREENLERLMENPNTILRRESPESIEDVLVDGQPLQISNIGPDGETHPNSSVMGRRHEGLSTPFKAGFSSSAGGKIVSIAGWKKNHKVKLDEYDREKYRHYNDHTISIEGEFDRDDLQFLIIRTPKNSIVRSENIGDALSGQELVEDYPELGLSMEDMSGFDYFIYRNNKKMPYAKSA